MTVRDNTSFQTTMKLKEQMMDFDPVDVRSSSLRGEK